MSFKAILGPIQTANGITMSSAFTNTGPVNIGNYRGVGIQFFWTGTPVGTLGISVSNISQKALINETVPSQSQFTALTLGSAFPSGNQPAGTAGQFYLDLDPLNAEWIEITYAYTSGSGTLNAWLKAKGNG